MGNATPIQSVVLVSFCCCNNVWFRTPEIFLLEEPRKEAISLPFPAFRDRLYSLACDLSFHQSQQHDFSDRLWPSLSCSLIHLRTPVIILGHLDNTGLSLHSKLNHICKVSFTTQGSIFTDSADQEVDISGVQYSASHRCVRVEVREQEMGSNLDAAIEKSCTLGQRRLRRSKGKTENEMVGWHHRLNGHKFE